MFTVKTESRVGVASPNASGVNKVSDSSGSGRVTSGADEHVMLTDKCGTSDASPSCTAVCCPDKRDNTSRDVAVERLIPVCSHTNCQLPTIQIRICVDHTIT